MKLGKLEEKELVPLLRHTGAMDPSVAVGPRFGEDAGVTYIGEHGLVVASDPVTFASARSGWYAVHINANDVAATGANPRWFMATVLLPQSADEKLIENIFAQIDDACTQLTVAVLGGHTEVTPGLKRPIICGTMIGVASEAGVITTGGARVGDAVVLTKGVCIEGTALLALEKEEESRKVLGKKRWERASRYLVDPGFSVVEDARIALEAVKVHAMHDPTEGGLAMGLYELAKASGHGVRIDEDRVPVLEEASDLCMHFGLDPLRTLGSGALLVCVTPEDVAPLLAAYRDAGIRAARIGTITEEGLDVYRNGLKYPLVHDAQDQITKIFD